MFLVHFMYIPHAGSLQITLLAEACQVLWQVVCYPDYTSTNYVGMFALHFVLFMCAILTIVRILLVTCVQLSLLINSKVNNSTMSFGYSPGIFQLQSGSFVACTMLFHVFSYYNLWQRIIIVRTLGWIQTLTKGVHK